MISLLIKWAILLLFAVNLKIDWLKKLPVKIDGLDRTHQTNADDTSAVIT